MSRSFDILIFQHFCFILGGVETLYYRMMKWANSKGMKSILIIDGDSQVDSTWKIKLKENNVELYYIFGVYPFYMIKDEQGIILDLSEYKSVLHISEFYEGYIRGEYLKSRYTFTVFVNLFYVLTSYDMMKSRIPLVRYLESKILGHIIESNSIVFMDEETRKIAVNAHNELYACGQTIVRLGYEVSPEISERLLYKKYNNFERHICSIARFEFPFKIYILGLIDVFVSLSKKYPILKLTIIGKGPGRNTVIKKIGELDNNIAERITLVDGCSYEELNTYIDEAFINVGMGTTILDFANRSVPSIISLANEIGDVSYGLWNENWHVLGGFLHDNMAPLKSISQCIEDVLQLEQKEYINICKLHRSLLINNYGMENVMENILTHDVVNVNPINPFLLHAYSVFRCFRTAVEGLLPKLSIWFTRDKRSL